MDACGEIEEEEIISDIRSLEMQGHMNSLPSSYVIYVHEGPPAPRVHDNYAAKTSRYLGITRIVIGVLSFLFQSLLITLEHQNWPAPAAFIGTGYWCGLVFIIAGSFGVSAAAFSSRCLIKTNFVFALLSLVLCGIPYIALSAYGVSKTTDKVHNKLYHHMVTVRSPLALYCLSLILAVTEVVCDIWSAVISNSIIGCGRPAEDTDPTHCAVTLSPEVEHALRYLHLNHVLPPGYSEANTSQLQSTTHPAPAVDNISGNQILPPAYTQDDPAQLQPEFTQL